MSAPTAVFGYGSLVSAASAAVTLGRPPQERWGEGAALAASLRGWRRRFSQARDNRACEKTFALDADDSVPTHVLGLNVEETGDPGDSVNGLLIAVDDAELARLDVRELRYDRREVRDAIEPAEAREAFASVVTYVAKREHLAPAPPPGAVILRSYAEAVESAFAGLGPGQLEEYRRTTGPLPVEPVAAHLVSDRIPEGNPRTW
jgi:cation transport regulator ChaC